MSASKPRLMIIGDNSASNQLSALLSGHDYDVICVDQKTPQAIKPQTEPSIAEWNRRVAEEKAAKRREKGKA